MFWQHLDDSYLLSNLLAVLMDLSPYIQYMSPYCSERVVALAGRLSVKFTRIMAAGDVGVGRDVGECLKVLLALIASTIR